MEHTNQAAGVEPGPLYKGHYHHNNESYAMNGIACGHWGIITWPDDKWWKNVLVNLDGEIEKFEPLEPVLEMRWDMPLAYRSTNPKRA